MNGIMFSITSCLQTSQTGQNCQALPGSTSFHDVCHLSFVVISPAHLPSSISPYFLLAKAYNAPHLRRDEGEKDGDEARKSHLQAALGLSWPNTSTSACPSTFQGSWYAARPTITASTSSRCFCTCTVGATPFQAKAVIRFLVRPFARFRSQGSHFRAMHRREKSLVVWRVT